MLDVFSNVCGFHGSELMVLLGFSTTLILIFVSSNALLDLHLQLHVALPNIKHWSLFLSNQEFFHV